jgi:hypothetical protein
MENWQLARWTFYSETASQSIEMRKKSFYDDFARAFSFIMLLNRESTRFSHETKAPTDEIVNLINQRNFIDFPPCHSPRLVSDSLQLCCRGQTPPPVIKRVDT